MTMRMDLKLKTKKFLKVKFNAEVSSESEQSHLELKYCNEKRGQLNFPIKKKYSFYVL